jgi:transcriptional regulator with XRE-family HTH domain
MTRAARRQLGMKVRALRDRRAMTQEVLAQKAGISRGYLARVETGRHEPTLTTLRKLAKALGVPVSELLA